MYICDILISIVYNSMIYFSFFFLRINMKVIENISIEWLLMNDEFVVCGINWCILCDMNGCGW